MKSSLRIRKEDSSIDWLISICNKEPFDEILTNTFFQEILLNYLTSLDTTVLISESENKILQLFDSKYFKSLDSNTKIKLLNDHIENSLPSVYYLGLHKLDNALWYLIDKNLVNFNDTFIEMLYIRKKNSKYKFIINEKELNEVEENSIIKKEKTVLAQDLKENPLLLLTIYLDEAKLNKTQLVLKLANLNKTSLFDKIHIELFRKFANFDPNNSDLVNSLIDDIVKLSTKKQNDLFLAKQLDDALNHIFNNMTGQEGSDSLLLVMTLIKKYYERSVIYQKFLDAVKEHLALKFPKKNYNFQNSDELNQSLVKVINQYPSQSFQELFPNLANMNYENKETKNFFKIVYLTLLGADVNHCIDGLPIIGKAILRKTNIKIFKFFNDFSANINICNPNGTTILMYAVEANYKEMIDFSIDILKVDINATNDMGSSALHKCNNISITKLLLEKGANCKLKDLQGKTPLENAKYFKEFYKFRKNFKESERYDKIINLLEEHMKNNVGSSSLAPIISNNDNVSQQYINYTSRINNGQSRGI